ncbi:hypothetical protein ACFSL4_14025 [Streptomyces caeni]|uniref:Uncharacterized protein n=1 Tax=Streptomyces caeni TaxID=2307231 RepID=A0ABW4ITN0_9ACTN
MMAGRLWRWLREDVWEIPFRRYAALLLAAALTAAAVWGGLRLGEQDRSCAKGVTRPGNSDDCVGVSVTAYDFGQPRFAQVIRAVDRENRRLAAGRYVTVALLEPFTTSDPDSVNDTLHELQGAYLAQYRANHEATHETPTSGSSWPTPAATGGTGRTWSTG